MTITRYTLGTSYTSGAGIPGIVESLHGEYVRYADYLAAITEWQAEKTGLEAIVTAQAETILALRGNHSGGATDIVGAPVAAQEPVGIFNGKFGGDVNGNMWFTVKAYDAIPAVGAKIYTAPQPPTSARDGWKLLPMTLTTEMKIALNQAMDDSCSNQGIWDSILNCVDPTPPADEQVRQDSHK